MIRIALGVCASVLGLLPAVRPVFAEPGGAFAKANELFAARRWREAAASCREVVRDDRAAPHAPTALRLLVNIHMYQGRLDELIGAELKAFRAGRDAGAGRILIQAYRRNLEPEKALELYGRLLEASPDDAGLLEEYAADLGRLESFDRAVGIYRRLARLNPAKRREYLVAAAELRRREGRYTGAEEEIAGMLSPDGAGTASFVEAARLYERMGHPGKALDMFRRAARLAPSDAGIGLELARRCRIVGFFAEAERLYRAGFAHSRKFAEREEILDGLYRLYNGRGKACGIIEGLVASLRTDPRGEALLVALPHFLASQGNHAEALEKIDVLLRAGRDDAYLLLLKARILEEIRKPREALAAYDSLPDSKEIDRDGVRERVGQLHGLLGQRDGMRQAWGKISDLERQARLLERYRMWLADAEGLYRRLIADNPLEARHYRSLQRLLAKQGRNKEALEVLEYALVLDPDDLDAASVAGGMYIEAGRREMAVETGRRILGAAARCEKREEADGKEEERLAELYRYWRGTPRWWYGGSHSPASAVASARAYFERHGLNNEFLRVLDEALDARPGNQRLAFEALLVLLRHDHRERAARLCRRLLDGEIDPQCVPRGFAEDARFVRDGLLDRLLLLHRESPLGESAAVEYGKRFEKERTLEHDYDYAIYAALLQERKKPSEALAVLGAGIDRVRDPAVLRWARAQLLMDRKRYGDAIEDLRWLLENRADRMRVDFRARAAVRVENLLFCLPALQRDAVTGDEKDLVRSVYARELLEEHPGRRMYALPTRRTCVMKIGRAYYEAGEPDRARKILATLHPRSDAEPADRVGLGNLYDEHDDGELAIGMFESEGSHRAYLERNLSFFLYRRVEEHMDGWYGPPHLGPLSRLYRKKKEYAKAYDAMRYGLTGSDYFRMDFTPDNVFYSFLKKYGIAEELISRYTASSAAAAGRYGTLAGALNGSSPLKAWFDAQRLRNEAVEEGYKLAEVYQFEGRYDEAAEVYRKLHAVDPGDMGALGCRRIIAMKKQDFETAIECQEKIVAFYEALASDPRKDEFKIHPMMCPFNPQSDRDDWDDFYKWGRHVYSRTYRYRQSGFSLGGEVADAHERLAATYVKAGDGAGAVRAMRTYMERADAGPGHVFAILGGFGRLCGLEEEMFPLQEKLALENRRDPHLQLAYLDLLAERKERKKATGLYRALKNRLAEGNLTADLAKEFFEGLSKAGKKLGLPPMKDPAADPDAIRRAARDLPGDAEARTRLAKLLYTEGRFDEALKATDSIVARMGDRSEHEALREKLQRMLGRHDEWLRERRDELAGAGPAERREILGAIGRHFYRLDDLDRAVEFFEKQECPADADKAEELLRTLEIFGRYGKMLEILERMEKSPGHSSGHMAVETSRASILLKLGRTDEASALCLEHLKEHGRSAYWDLFRQRGKIEVISRAVDEAVGRDPGNVRALEHKRELLGFLGRRDGEMETCRTILRRNPRNDDERGRLMVLMSEAGDFEGIEAQAREVLKPGAETADEYRWILGKCLLRRGRRDEAVACFRKIHPEDDTDSAYKTMRVFIAERLFPEAREMFRRYMKSDPAPTKALEDLTLYLQLAEGDLDAAYETAVRRFRLFVSRAADDRDGRRKPSDTPPIRDMVLYHLARVTGRMDEYIELLKETAAQDSARVAYQLELAGVYARENRAKDYERWLEHLVKTFPRNRELRGYLLARYENDQDWKRCIELVRRQMAEVPGDERFGRMRIARYNEYLGRLDEAGRLFGQLVEETGKAERYAGLARWNAYHGRLEKAREAMEKAVKAATRSRNRLLADYARILALCGDSEGAIRAYHRGIKGTSREILPVGWKRREYGQEDRELYGSLRKLYAKTAFAARTEKSLRERPDDAGLIHDMAIVSEALGEKEEALALYLRLHEGNPCSMRFLEKICGYLAELGRYAEAVPYYEKICRIIEHDLRMLGDADRVREFLKKPLQSELDPGRSWEQRNLIRDREKTLAGIRMRIGTIRHETEKDPKAAMKEWKYSLDGVPGLWGGRGRDDGECFLLNRGYPELVVRRAGRCVLPRIAYGGPVWSRGIDYRLLIAYLETGRMDAVKAALARHVCAPDGKGEFFPWWYRSHDFVDVDGPFCRLSEDRWRFYAALEKHGRADEIAHFLEKEFAAHAGRPVNQTLLELAAWHRCRRKQYDRVERLIEAHYPTAHWFQRQKKAGALISIAVERADWKGAVEGLRAALDDAGASQRVGILKIIADIHEEKTREYGKALAAYREIENARRPPKDYRADAILSVLEATCWELSPGDRPGLVERIRWCERDDGYDAVGFDLGRHESEPDYRDDDEREYPRFHSGLGFDARLYDRDDCRIACRDMRVLDGTEEAFLNRDTGRRFDILRLLLKLKRADEAAALERDLLSVFPKELEGGTRPELVRRVFLERAARAHADAGDCEGAMKLYAEAHDIDTELARRTISIAVRRDSALREAADRHLRTRMQLARKAGQVEEYFKAFESWKVLQEGQYKRERGYGLSGDGVLTGMVSRLVDIPNALLRRESVDEAETLLSRLEDRDARGARLLAAAVHLHRGRFAEAAALCNGVIEELEEAGKRKRLEERFLGNARDLSRYREEEDPLEDLEVGDLLLMARVYGAVGRKDISKRLIGCAGKADEEKEHFRWDGIDPR